MITSGQSFNYLGNYNFGQNKGLKCQLINYYISQLCPNYEKLHLLRHLELVNLTLNGQLVT